MSGDLGESQESSPLSLCGKPGGQKQESSVKTSPEGQKLTESCGKSSKGGGDALIADESLRKTAGILGLYL